MTFPGVQALASWHPALQMMAHHRGLLTVLSEWGTIGCSGCEWVDRTAIAGTGGGTCNCTRVNVNRGNSQRGRSKTYLSASA